MYHSWFINRQTSRGYDAKSFRFTTRIPTTFATPHVDATRAQTRHRRERVQEIFPHFKTMREFTVPPTFASLAGRDAETGEYDASVETPHVFVKRPLDVAGMCADERAEEVEACVRALCDGEAEDLVTNDEVLGAAYGLCWCVRLFVCSRARVG